MPYLPLYILNTDIDLINDWLNKNDEIYFTQLVDYNYWKLVKEVIFDKQKMASEYKLWHLPSGPIPIIEKKNYPRSITIESIVRKKKL